MAAIRTDLPGPIGEKKLEKKPIKFSNLLLGAGLNMFEVTTLGQPLEVVKTTMAANRGDGMAKALGRVWSRGGPLGCKSTLTPLVTLSLTPLESTKVSSPGPGSKLPPRAPSFSSSPPRPSTTPASLAPPSLAVVSSVASPVVSPRPMPPWVSVPA